MGHLVFALSVKSAPIAYGTLFVAAVLADGTDIMEPKTASWALMAGFTGMLTLQAWVIKFLLTEYRGSLEKLAGSVAELKSAVVARECPELHHTRKTVSND